MVDLYFKGPNDITYNEFLSEENDELNQLIGQIKMILFTDQGTVLGNLGFGANLQRLIFETNYNQYTILNNLKYQFSQYLNYDTDRFTINTDLKFFRGTLRDMALLTIDINAYRVLDILIK